jgi:hypothetical protein
MSSETKRLRRELEKRIEYDMDRLMFWIEVLNRLDGNPDDEPEVDACAFEDDRRRHAARDNDCEDFEPDADSEPDEGKEDSLVPVFEKVGLSRVWRDVHRSSAADVLHRNAERERRIANGSGRIARLDYGPFNPVRDEFRIVKKNYDPMRRVRL